MTKKCQATKWGQRSGDSDSETDKWESKTGNSDTDGVSTVTKKGSVRLLNGSNGAATVTVKLSLYSPNFPHFTFIFFFIKK